MIFKTESGRVSKKIPGSGSGSGTRWALVQYHTVYVKRCENHCGASQNIQQAQGRQNPQGAWQYDPGGDFNDENIDLGGSYNGDG